MKRRRVSPRYCKCGGLATEPARRAGGGGKTQEWTFYAHLREGSNNHLVKGQTVVRGEQIGEVGNVGSTGGVPHMHFSSLDRSDPDPLTEARTFPTYFNNVVFPTPGHTVWRLQLDVALPSDTVLTDVHDPPTPLPRNVPSAPGVVSEVEPNDRLIQHQALSFPPDTVVNGMAETGEVGDLAVRGDGIEDVFRIDLPARNSLRVALTTPDVSQNLDVYVLDEDLRVLNKTGEGVAPAGQDDVACFDDLEAGVYYIFVTSADTIKTAAAPYQLSIGSDAQKIQVTVTNATQPIEVDGNCTARVEVEIAIHDNCCLNANDLGLVVSPQPIPNATLGEWVEDSRVALDARNVLVTGRVDVSALTSCPVVVRIDARAQDCDGRVVDTALDGGAGIVDVVDVIPPVVKSSVATSRLWPPGHEFVDVGFMATATDNCDAGVSQTLTTAVWSDEPGNAKGDGNATPDATELQGALWLRAERQGMEDGRVYLLSSDATDACGNRAFACTTLGVAHDKLLLSEQSLSAQEQAALQFCQANDGDAPASFYLQGP